MDSNPNVLLNDNNHIASICAQVFNFTTEQLYDVAEVINFTTGQLHDVAEVTKTAYDACNTTNNIYTVSTGPASIPLNRPEVFYFTCTVPGHCSGGQKLHVEVRNGNNRTAATPTSPGTSSPPSETNSASSLVSTLSPVFFMAIALVLMC
ncbi:hypothetical protein GOBAR_DD02094 [Gossypium barbadense]|nr:hypothetical protein GOBAR_DD02094 [Gossypium barbadense]